MKKINLHDQFFKEVFSKKNEIKDLIIHTFPKELVDRIDFNSLQPVNTSYTDKELKENFSDLVYQCKYNGEKQIYLALLFEHKSYQPDYPHLQLLKYLIKIWDANIKQKQKLIPVIPIIVYHGKKKWKVKKFTDYFSGIDKELIPFLPDFKYLLTDLSTYTDEEILNLFKTITVQTSLLLMKNIFREINLWENLPLIFSKINSILKKEEGENFFISVIKYIFVNVEDHKKVIQTINTISAKGGKMAKSAATKLREEGREEGIEEGIEKGIEKGREKGIIETQKNTIIKLYKKAKFTVQQIVDYLEIDRSFVVRTLREKRIR